MELYPMTVSHASLPTHNNCALHRVAAIRCLCTLLLLLHVTCDIPWPQRRHRGQFVHLMIINVVGSGQLNCFLPTSIMMTKKLQLELSKHRKVWEWRRRKTYFTLSFSALVPWKIQNGEWDEGKKKMPNFSGSPSGVTVST